MTTVLVTRPIQDAARLAIRLEALEYAPIIEPMLSIVPTREARPGKFAPSGIVVTSRNALVAIKARRHDVDDLFDKPCFCVGPRTAEAARSLGFKDVIVAKGDAISLAAAVDDLLSPSSRPVLYIRGEEVTGVVQDVLKEAGHAVVDWAVYRAQAASVLSPGLQKRLAEEGLGAALFFSKRTAEVYANLLVQHELEASSCSMTAIGLSEEVTQPLAPFFWKRLIAANAPNEDAMIDALVEFCPVAREDYEPVRKFTAREF